MRAPHALARPCAALRRAVLLVFCAALAHVPGGLARAQPVRIVATTPAEGAVAVAAEARIELRVDPGVPPNGSRFDDAVRILAPEATVVAYGHDCSAPGPCEGVPMDRIFYDLRHDEAMDVVVLVHGLRACERPADWLDDAGCFAPGTPARRAPLRMEAPFVLTYTTAPAWGDASVAGHVAHAAGKAPPALSRLATAARRWLGARPTRRPMPTPRAALQPSEGLHGVVLLLDAPAADLPWHEPAAWRPHRAAAVGTDGAYRITDVRAGRYVPVALAFAPGTALGLSHVGFHDADGDRQPDALTVPQGGSVDLPLQLFALGPATSGDYAPLARDAAARQAPHAELLRVEARDAHAALAVQPDGRADAWRYTFLDRATDSLLVVDVDAHGLALAAAPAHPADHLREPLPVGFASSATVLAAADADCGAAEIDCGAEFRARHPEALVLLRAGDLPITPRFDGVATVWEVRYVAEPDGEIVELLRYLDAATGAPVDRATRRDALPRRRASAIRTLYPNPTAGDAVLEVDLTAPSRMRVDVFDVLGRPVAHVLDGHRGAGRHAIALGLGGLARGTYFVRVRVGDDTAVRPILLSR